MEHSANIEGPKFLRCWYAPPEGLCCARVFKPPPVALPLHTDSSLKLFFFSIPKKPVGRSKVRKSSGFFPCSAFFGSCLNFRLNWPALPTYCSQDVNFYPTPPSRPNALSSGLSGSDFAAMGFEFGDVPRPLRHGHSHVFAQQGWTTSHSFLRHLKQFCHDLLVTGTILDLFAAGSCPRYLSRFRKSLQPGMPFNERQGHWMTLGNLRENAT